MVLSLRASFSRVDKISVKSELKIDWDPSTESLRQAMLDYANQQKDVVKQEWIDLLKRRFGEDYDREYKPHQLAEEHKKKWESPRTQASSTEGQMSSNFLNPSLENIVEQLVCQRDEVWLMDSPKGNQTKELQLNDFGLLKQTQDCIEIVDTLIQNPDSKITYAGKFSDTLLSRKNLGVRKIQVKRRYHRARKKKECNSQRDLVQALRSYGMFCGSSVSYRLANRKADRSHLKRKKSTVKVEKDLIYHNIFAKATRELASEHGDLCLEDNGWRHMESSGCVVQEAKSQTMIKIKTVSTIDDFLKKTVTQSEDSLVSLALICSFRKMRGYLKLGDSKGAEIPEDTIKGVADTMMSKNGGVSMDKDILTELSLENDVCKSGGLVNFEVLERCVFLLSDFLLHLEDKVSLSWASNSRWKMKLSEIRKIPSIHDKSQLSLEKTSTHSIDGRLVAVATVANNIKRTDVMQRPIQSHGMERSKKEIPDLKSETERPIMMFMLAESSGAEGENLMEWINVPNLSQEKRVLIVHGKLLVTWLELFELTQGETTKMNQNLRSCNGSSRMELLKRKEARLGMIKIPHDLIKSVTKSTYLEKMWSYLYHMIKRVVTSTIPSYLARLLIYEVFHFLRPPEQLRSKIGS